MSLWKDDFYSTKVTSGRPGYGYRSSSGTRKDRRLALAVVLSSISCVLLGVLIIAVMMLAERAPRKEAAVVRPVWSESLGRSEEDLTVLAVQKANGAVVSIIGVFERSGGSEGRAPRNEVPFYSNVSLGSGVVFEINKQRALIVTNYHVIEGASEVEVVVSDQSRRTAKVIGADEISDLAVLEIDADGVPEIAHFGDSSLLQKGETVVAIGNPLGLGSSVSKGVISSPNQVIPVMFAWDGSASMEIEVIQTDAAINSGNSGGALVNLAGQVIGINSRKIMETGVEGLGFAIPINQVKPIIDSLLEHGEVKRAYMGIVSQDLRYYEGNVAGLKLPESVQDGIVLLETSGPAATAGLQEHDVIVQLDDTSVRTVAELRRYLYQHKQVGDGVQVVYYRGGKQHSTTLELGELPER